MAPSKAVYFADRKKWREWLENNCDTETEIWLIYYKKHTGIERIRYDDAVEEAICFGWIDSIVKRIDDDRYMQKFTPRKEKSKWSDLNKRRAAKMIKTGSMTGAGMAKIRAAKNNGEWNKAENKTIVKAVPPDLESALSKNGEAAANFKKMAPSYRRNLIGWIESAKREGTRGKRIAQTVEMAERNEKPGMK